MNRKIPATMGTQHPDSASRRVPIQDEVDEAVDMLSPDGLGIQEVMVDFEGKLTPWHQPWQIAVALQAKGLRPGVDVFITPRLPSAEQESVARQLMGILAAVDALGSAAMAGHPPIIHEVVIPMTESGEALWRVRERIRAVMDLLQPEWPLDLTPESLHVIPLIESVPHLVRTKHLLGHYLTCCREGGYKLGSLRVMIGRSDPALWHGMVAAVMANKLAVSACRQLSLELGVRIAPIWGAGGLPFRGHLTPDNVENVVAAYPGVHTMTIQSGPRYDYPREQVRALVRRLNEALPRQPGVPFDEGERSEMATILGVFAKYYVRTVSRFASSVAAISDLVPRQRDRLTRDSLAGYGRAMRDLTELSALISDPKVAEELDKEPTPPRVVLPRVIAFCAAMYSIGVPPEFIGTGRGLRAIRERLGEEVLSRFLRRYYPSLGQDLVAAHRHLHLENAACFLDDASLAEIREDIGLCGEHFDLEGPPEAQPTDEYISLLEAARPLLRRAAEGRAQLSGQQARLLDELILALGRLRGSLG
jgi:phosphoenolpyruvate carboxylase